MPQDTQAHVVHLSVAIAIVSVLIALYFALNSTSNPKKNKPIDLGERRKNILLIIDPQNDFHPGGSLAVTGANEDSARTARLIDEHTNEIDEIYVTLDSHHRNHIAHAVFWKDKEGRPPANFSIITHEDIKSGKYTPVDPALRAHSLEYTKFLEDKGKFKLCIWPEHCLIGTPGHAVVPVLNVALQKWVKERRRNIHYVLKGENCLTEMYSAIKADFEVPDDPRTSRSPALQRELQNTDRLLVCGQALSHCVHFTFVDILETWPEGRNHQLALLTDAASPVGGFEEQGQAFIREIESKGCTLTTTATAFK